jgi:hypothetical protein
MLGITTRPAPSERGRERYPRSGWTLAEREGGGSRRRARNWGRYLPRTMARVALSGLMYEDGGGQWQRTTVTR